MIGLGYYGTSPPPVIQRTVLENPAWYTAYTPYQPEISQGRLEALINFQTMVADLTGLDVAGASMLDESTAAAEAMTLVRRAGRAKPEAVFVVDADTLPQTLGRAGDPRRAAGHPPARRRPVRRLADRPARGRRVRRPAVLPGRERRGPRPPGAGGRRARGRGVGRRRRRPAGADAAGGAGGVGRRRRLRHHPALRRPHGLRRPARRLPLGPRGAWPASCPAAWSVSRWTPTATSPTGWPCRPASSTSAARRRPATSAPRRCCSPSWPAPTPSTTVPRAWRRSRPACTAAPSPLAGWLRAGGLEIVHEHFFDTLEVAVPGRAPPRWWRPPPSAGSTCGWSTPTPWRSPATRRRRPATLRAVAEAFGVPPTTRPWTTTAPTRFPADLRRRTAYLTAPGLLRAPLGDRDAALPAALSDKDLALDRTMIPLGSCTMKLNAATEMAAITWPEFANLHPFVPVEQARGYAQLIDELCDALAEVTGYAAVSVQPNAGLAGRVRRAAGDPRLPPLPRRRAARRLPDPELGARHQRRQRGHGRHARGRRRLRRGRQRRRRRPARQGRPARRAAGRDHADLPVDARRVRARHPGDLRRGARRRRPGLRRRRQPQRDGRAGQAGALRLRRQPPQPAQDVLHPARRRRPGRRADRRPRAPGAVPAGPPAGRHRGRRARSCPGPRGARPASCRSRGPTSG